MKTIQKVFLLLSALPMVFIFSAASKAETWLAAPDEEPILVGRISHIEGELIRHQPGDEAWTPTLADTPFGAGESLYTEESSRAEIILPNGTWARFDGGTQIQFIELKDDLTDFDLGSGTGRFYSQGAYSLIKVRTVFGVVTAPGGAAFDVHLYGDAVEVIALKGSVSFSQGNTGRRFEVTAGLGSIVADTHAVSAGKGYAPPGWAAWNRERDALWAGRMTSGEVSAAYLPPSLRHEAYALDENGVWERAYYGDGYYYFWRPTHVGAGWSPFTVGCWNTWYHESTWVPYEPFGYVTHHYGNWVFIGNSWYWAPPVAGVRHHVGRPLFNIGFAWYPGRVAWIQSGLNVGWVPLAPHEPYYAHRRWGHKAVVVKNVHVTNLNVNVTHYKNHRHAVVIDRNDLHRARNFRDLMKAGVDRASMVRNYHVAPTLDRIAKRPIADTRDGRHPARAVPKSKSHFMPAEKNGHNRLERVGGVNLQTTKTGQTLSSERLFTARERPQAQPRKARDGITEWTRPTVIKSSQSKQAKTIGVVSKRREPSETSVKKREAQKSIALSQPTARKVDPRKGAPEVTRTPNRPMVERTLSKPAEEGRKGFKYQSSPGKLNANEGRAKSKPSFFGAKGGASDNGKRPEQRQQTRVTTPSQAFKGGNDPKATSGTGRVQSLSRGSTGGNSRGFFRN